MSLVAYDYSDDDEDDESVGPTVTSVVSQNADMGNKPVTDREIPPISASASSSFGMMAVKSATGKIQILAPSFDNLDSSSDEDEDRPKLRNLKPSAKGSGLRSILPPAKSSSSKFDDDDYSFAPRSATQPASKIITPSAASSSTSSITSLIPQSVKRKPVESVSLSKKKKEEDDVEMDPSKFFSLSDDTEATEQMDAESVPDKYLPSVNMTPALASDVPVVYEIPAEDWSQMGGARQGPGMSELQFKKKIASKFGDEDADRIQLVDVNVNDHLLHNKEYLKSLTAEKDQVDKDAPQPNPTVRRKHHITYLAHQAKQRELALKEEWARNRATRNQSRAKYGF